MVSQLMRNGTVLSYNEFKEAYPQIQINFLTYNGLIRSIIQYKNKLNLEGRTKKLTMQPHLWTILSQKRGTKYIYRNVIEAAPVIKGIEKWKTRFETDIKQDTLFKMLKKATSDTKLLWLQMRILHNILTTNKSVARYKDEQSETCTFCKLYPESIEHLFWNCTIITLFWQKLLEPLKQTCTHCSRLNFNKQLIILGADKINQTDQIIDFIILLAKQYIYRSKVYQTKPNIKAFLSILINRYNIEKEISFMHSNHRQFVEKWNPYKDVVKEGK